PQQMRLDALRSLDHQRRSRLNRYDAPKTIRSSKKAVDKETFAATTLAACPADEVPILDPENPDAEALTESIPNGGSVDKEDFCLVFLSEPKTEADKAKIEA